MQLSDRLSICLLAVQYRYPDVRIAINTTVWFDSSLSAQELTIEEMMLLLRSRVPALLTKTGCLVLDAQSRAIYVPEIASASPVFYLHSYDRRQLLGFPDALKKAHSALYGSLEKKKPVHARHWRLTVPRRKPENPSFIQHAYESPLCSDP